MSRIHSFFKNSIVYFLGKILTFLVSIFLLPLYTKHIGVNDYGNYELIRSILDLLIPFLCAECWKAVFRLSFSSKFKDNKVKLFTTSIYFCFSCCVLMSLSFGIYCYYSGLSFFSLILIFTETLSFLYQYIARSLNKNLSFSISGIAGSVVNGITGLIFIFIFKYYSNAMIIALFTGQFVQLIILFISTKGWAFLKPSNISKMAFVEIVKFAWPFGLTSLAYFFGNGFSKLFIGYSLGADNVAIYGVALKFIVIITLISSVVEMSWSDLLYSIDDKQERISVTEHWTNMALRLFSIACPMFMVVIQFLFPLLVGVDYNGAYSLIPYLYVSTFFIMANDILLNPCRAENKPWINLIAKTIRGVVNVILLFLLSKHFGLIGACLAYSISIFVEYIVFMISNRTMLGIKVDFIPSVIFVSLYIPIILCVLYSNISLTILLTLVIFIFGLIYAKELVMLFLSKFGMVKYFRLYIEKIKKHWLFLLLNIVFLLLSFTLITVGALSSVVLVKVLCFSIIFLMVLGLIILLFKKKTSYFIDCKYSSALIFPILVTTIFGLALSALSSKLLPLLFTANVQFSVIFIFFIASYELILLIRRNRNEHI